MAKSKGKQTRNHPNPRKEYRKKAREQHAQTVQPQVTAVMENHHASEPCSSQGEKTMPHQSQGQKRAKFALEQIEKLLREEYGSNSCPKAQELKSHASALPAMILMNGFGQAAAFYFSKGGVHRDLYKLLSEWLTGSERPYEDQKDLLIGITQLDLNHYLLAQAEAQALLEWVKKFTNALVEKPGENKGATT